MYVSGQIHNEGILLRGNFFLRTEGLNLSHASISISLRCVSRYKAFCSHEKHTTVAFSNQLQGSSQTGQPFFSFLNTKEGACLIPKRGPDIIKIPSSCAFACHTEVAPVGYYAFKKAPRNFSMSHNLYQFILQGCGRERERERETNKE